MIVEKEYNKNPLVTVCIPAYNHDKFVGETIQSVLNQTYSNIELVIINDGSKDNTHEVICKYISQCEEKFIRFIYKNRENRGLVATLNEMINLSEGKYIKFIASDDFLRKDMIKESISFFNRTDVDLIFFNLDIIDESSNLVNENISGIKGLEKEIGGIQNLTLEKSLEYNRFFGPAYIIKREIYKRIGNYNEKISIEDWEFLLRCVSNKIKLGYLNKSLVAYRSHSDNTWKKPIFVLINNLKILNNYKDVPNHRDRVLALIVKTINTVLFFNKKDYKNIKKLLKIIKQEGFSCSCFLSLNTKVFLKYCYLNIIYGFLFVKHEIIK